MKRHPRFKDSYISYVLVFFFFYFCMASFSSVLSVYLTGLGKPASEMAFIVSSAGLFSLAAAPAVGYLSDRTGRPKLISSLLLLGVGVLGLVFAFCRGTWALFLLNGLIMSFINSVMPVGERLAGACRFRYGAVRVWGTFGYAAGAQAAGLVLEYLPSPVLFILLLFSCLMAVLGFWGVGDVKPPEEEKGERTGLPVLLGNPRFLFFLVISLLFYACSGANMTYAPVLLTSLNVPSSAVGTVLLFSTLTELPIILFSNKFMDRFSGKALLLADFAVITAQFLLYGLSRSAAATVAAMVLLKAVASTLYMMIELKAVRTLIGARYTTTGLAVVNTVNSLGTIVMQNVGGAVVDGAGIYAFYLVMAGFTALGTFLTLFLKMDRGEKVFS